MLKVYIVNEVLMICCCVIFSECDPQCETCSTTASNCDTCRTDGSVDTTAPACAARQYTQKEG